MKTILIQKIQSTDNCDFIKLLNPLLVKLDFNKARTTPIDILRVSIKGNEGFLIFDNIYPTTSINNIKNQLKDVEGTMIFISNSKDSKFEEYQFDLVFKSSFTESKDVVNTEESYNYTDGFVSLKNKRKYINNSTEIEYLLNEGIECSDAQDNGVLNIRKEENGKIVCEVMRYNVRIELKEYKKISKVIKWYDKWIEKIH